MSNERVVRAALFLLAVLLPLFAASAPLRAQSRPGAPASDSPIDAFAELLAESTRTRWAGQRVPRRLPVARPLGATLRIDSVLRPLSVHADPRAARVALAEDVLDALEAAADLLRMTGWSAPAADGGRGGTDGFDLYLADLDGEWMSVRPDAEAPLSFEDSVASHVVVDPDVDPELLPACVAQAYAEAVLLATDPAEAPPWHRATAVWLAWMITGRFGCDEDDVARAMATPALAPIPDLATQRGEDGATDDGRPRSGAGGAVWLALLDAYHSGGTGRLVRDAWQFARQRTWEGHDLRGSPDLFQVMRAMFPVDSESLDDVLEAVAFSRWQAGTAAAPSFALRAIPRLAAPAYAGPFAWASLPRRARVDAPAVRAFGSGYVVVDTREAPPGASLRVWLRGEYGTRWSLLAVRLDADGRVLSQLSAPPRRLPRSYLVVELREPTDHVLLAVTNLGPRLPDADSIDVNERAFELVVDRGGAP
jgi:hypothetical protein